MSKKYQVDFTEQTELHKRIKALAAMEGKTMNDIIIDAVKIKVNKSTKLTELQAAR
jgi:NRPS condensation-like uncharacterized protein